MPARKGGRRRKAQRGAGIGQDIWNGLKSANNYLKKTKLVSKVANTIGNATGMPVFNKVGATANQWGYGGGYGYGAQNMAPRPIRQML